MPLFVDLKDTVRLHFPADCPVPDVRPYVDPDTGEERTHWIEVLASIGDGDWRRLRNSGLRGWARTEEDDKTDELDEVRFDFDRAATLRMSMWIVGFSFPHPRHGKYPTNRQDRVRWLADLWPPLGEVVRQMLNEHVEKAWALAQAEVDPESPPGSSGGQTESQTRESNSSGDTSTSQLEPGGSD